MQCPQTPFTCTTNSSLNTKGILISSSVNMQKRSKFRYCITSPSAQCTHLMQQRAHDSQQKEIEQTQIYIDKNRVHAATAKMAQSRIKRLERMVIIPEVLNDPLLRFVLP